ncbi:hypothetical protein [Kitasatospora sp. NPDC094015]|uniref:hypothetical protein n=1 Tax=Kitasatospora sp. NPDC094015 TaxID=3155205 RepID=UPI00332E6C86
MPRLRTVLPVAVLAALAAAPAATAAADTPVGGCQGAGSITASGDRDTVNVQRGHSGVVSASLRTGAALPEGATLRVQLSTSPAGGQAPGVSWRIDGGGWHGTGLHAERGQVGDAYWMSPPQTLPPIGPGTHRLELTVTVPADGPLTAYRPNVYLDSAAPCSQLLGSVGLSTIQTQGNAADPQPAPAKPTSPKPATPSPTRPRPTATASPTADPAATAPSATPAEPSPTPTPTAEPAAATTATPTPAASPSGSPAPLALAATEPAADASHGTAWAVTGGVAVLLAAGGTAVGVRRWRRRSA